MKQIFSWCVTNNDDAYKDIDTAIQPENLQKNVPKNFVAEMWGVVAKFCTMKDRVQKLIPLCKSIFLQIIQDDEYKLMHLMNERSHKYCYVKLVPKYCYVPSEKYLKQVFYKIWHCVKPIYDPYAHECSLYMPEPQLEHKVPTRVILAMQHYYSDVQVQDALLFIMKHLPWNPMELTQCKFPKIAAMAKKGVQLMSLYKEGPLQLENVLKIVPTGLEDFANCIMYTYDRNSYVHEFPVFGVLIQTKTEQCLLAALRSSNNVAYMHRTENAYVTSEEGIILALAKSGTKLIDPQSWDVPEFVQKAILIDTNLFENASSAIKDNDSVIGFALVHGKYQALEYASARLQKKHYAKFLHALKVYPTHIIDPYWQDNDTVMRIAVTGTSSAYSCASNRLKNDEEFSMLACKQSSSLVYTGLPEHFQKQPKFVKAFLQQNIDNMMYVDQKVIESIPKLVALQKQIRYLHANKTYQTKVAETTKQLLQRHKVVPDLNF